MTNTTPGAEASSPPRIVSLLPSATEILCALGFGEALVGRSHECDFPPGVERLPIVTAPRFPVEGSSGEIDRRVKSLARQTAAKEALGIYEVRTDALRRLRPTHIVTQTLCDVCAVSLRDVEAAVAHLTGSEAQLVALQPDSLEGVWRDFERVGAALGDPSRGAALTASCRRRIDAIADRAGRLPAKPRVAVIEWVDPLMAAGHWTPTLVELAGGNNLFGAAGSPSPWLDFAALAAARPEVVLVAPCGFSLDRTRQDFPHLRARPGWDALPAVATGRVYLADGHRYFNRPGPRLVETLEILAEILHPENFSFGHEGSGWERAPCSPG